MGMSAGGGQFLLRDFSAYFPSGFFPDQALPFSLPAMFVQVTEQAQQAAHAGPTHAGRPSRGHRQRRSYRLVLIPLLFDLFLLSPSPLSN